MSRFVLTKWYVDCADGEGRAAILYWTALRWNHVAITWSGLSFSEPGREAVHRASLASTAAPAREDSAISWDGRHLGCRVRCEPTLPPFAERLLEQPAGAVDWTVEAPAARVEVALDDGPTIRGVGYAERLDLTLPPWSLPIDELRWGRWASHDAEHSVVWIAWLGSQPRADVYLDAVRQPAARIDADVIAAESGTLSLSERVTIYSRSVGEVLGGIRPLASLLPATWLAVEDAKWLSAGTLARPGVSDRRGWAIHERVRFP